MTTPPTPLPEPAELRKIAMAIYTPPFKYQRGYIFDSQSNMVADNDEVNDAVASRVRGWGKLGYLPHGAEIQDEIGRMMADSLNALYKKDDTLRQYGEAEYRRGIEDAAKVCMELNHGWCSDDAMTCASYIRKLGEPK